MIAIDPKLDIGVDKSLCDVLVISEDNYPKVIRCFDNQDITDVDRIRSAATFGRDLKNNI